MEFVFEIVTRHSLNASTALNSCIKKIEECIENKIDIGSETFITDFRIQDLPDKLFRAKVVIEEVNKQLSEDEAS